MNGSSDEQLLEWFRQWLVRIRAEADQYKEPAAVQVPVPMDKSGVGLYRLVEEFTALRQEIKIQSRAARGLEEEAEKLLEGLRAALETIDRLARQPASSAGAPSKGWALAVAELDEAFERGRMQLGNLRNGAAQRAEESMVRDLEECYYEQSWLTRWFSRSYYQVLRERMLAKGTGRRDRSLDAFSDGYGLIQQRLMRLMSGEQIVRMQTVGRTVDPDEMIVVETVDGAAEPGTVVDEIRPGYWWNGTVLRCAEVRAIKFQPELK